jgi:RHH-type rel operon transcriptional repressor/antitoxin RelB
MATEKTVSFRADADQIRTLDSLASAQDRPRSYLINEAISNYIDLQAYQDALVRKGIEDAQKGNIVSHDAVMKRLKRMGRTASD